MNIENMELEKLTGTPLGMRYPLYLTQDVIDQGNDYSNFITFCSSLSEYDQVDLHISCLGGRVSTTSIIATAIENSRATFIAHLNSICWSGATVVALSCDGWVLGDMVEFGLHSTQGGTGYSELSKVKMRTDAMERMNDLIDSKYYSNLLTPEEIKRMKDGAEITFFKDELTERLKVYAEKRSEKLFKKDIESQNDLSEFTSEQLEDEVIACREDIKLYQKELKGRLKEKGGVSKCSG